MASLFFQDSKADRIKSHLDGIGYEILDSAGKVKDSVIDSLDRQSLVDWFEAHGVSDVASQTIENAKKHKEWLVEDVRDYAQNSQDFASKLIGKGKDFFNQKTAEASNGLYRTWSDSKLKEFLDARGVKVPQGSNRDQLNALLARAKHNSPINFKGPAGDYWFDGWTREELATKLRAAGKSADGSRKQLADRLYKVYSESYDEGRKQGEEAAEAISAKAGKVSEEGQKAAQNAASELRAKFGEWREASRHTFDSWSFDDLKEYLLEFGHDFNSGVANTKDKLVDSARDNYYYFVHGEPRPKSLLDRFNSFCHGVQLDLHDRIGRFLGVNSLLHNEL